MHELGRAPIGTEELLGLFVITVLGLALVVHWFRRAKLRPDPWELEPPAPVEDQGGSSSKEQPMCIRCLTPHEAAAYFCPKCGHAVGPYNNYMPFVQLFSEGEVMRAATDGSKRLTPFTLTGYLLLSLATFNFMAPLFWGALFKRYAAERSQRRNPPAEPGS